jgi:hypothetical protein
METFLVMLSDQRTDIPTPPAERSPRIWGYELEAEDAQSAVQPAIDRWHAELGDQRPALSIAAVPISALPGYEPGSF